jgi:hypothetical protein
MPALSRRDAGTGNLGGLVRPDIAEHVGGDDHVELPGIADQRCRHGVDQALFAVDAGMPRRYLPRGEEKPSDGATRWPCERL